MVLGLKGDRRNKISVSAQKYFVTEYTSLKGRMNYHCDGFEKRLANSVW